MHCIQLQSQVVDSLQKRILLTEVALGDNITNVSTKKIEIAFTTACLLSKQYEPLLPKQIVTELRQKNLPYSSLKEITQNLSQVNVSYVAQLSILRLGNVVRISMKVDNVNDTLPVQTGIGYALLNYRVANAKDSILYDVALLEGIQKSLAQVMKQPKLFVSLDGKFQVIPSSPLIIGGIAFIGNDSFPKWDLFKEKTAVSYDAVASMFMEMKDNKNFTTYDIDSRDSLFAIFHLYGLENYQAPTVQEIKAMYANEVPYYITGLFIRTAQGADLQLILCYVNGKTSKLNALYSSKASIKNDSKVEFKEVLIKTLKDLLVQFPSLLDTKN